MTRKKTEKKKRKSHSFIPYPIKHIHNVFNTELYRRGRIQKFPLTVCKAVPHEWHCVLPTGN